ncbi:sodium-coupled monocarboxylate transporter 1 [Aplysia californica]|uniref:Sodium-coupled monocarboxylate transporter 1 n=1 Tax=Aplysia californica TaxID=6500 RepID=A0ABM1VWV9_APLCA|nr:sodium-coupled monocarboxylate transporter 1 [Aplysia californica]
MVQVRNDFTPWDYVVFAGMLSVSMGIGIFFAYRQRRQESQGDYLMASRSLGIIPVSISILVSFMSAILILGTPAEMYKQGAEYFISLFGIFFGILMAVFLFVPLLYPLKMTSAFEYLERRYNSRLARLVGTSIMIVTQILYMGIASFAPATALEAVTGFPVWATIITIGVVATFYTSIGGMRAVVWTDVFQAMVMLAGLLAIVIQGTMKLGGLSEVWSTADDWKRLKFLTWNPDPTVRHTVWGLVFGAGFQWMTTYGFNQASVQRYCSLSTLNKARASIFLNIVGVTILVSITCLSGIVMFSYYASQNCDPLGLNMVDNPNQLIPFFVMETLAYPGLPGLFISSLFSGALSSVSSSLSALAAITWEDILKIHLDHKLTEANKTRLTKVLVVIYGATAVGMAFIAQNLEGTVLQAAVGLIGAAGGPMTGMFLLGAFFPWANKWGAVIGAFVGEAIAMWLAIGSYAYGIPVKPMPFPNGTCSADLLNVNGSMTTVAMTTVLTTSATTITTGMTPGDNELNPTLQWLYSISYMWYTGIGMTLVVLVGLPVSFLTGANSIHDVPAKYQIPFFTRIFCCLPNSWLRRLACNRDFPNPEDIRADEKDEEIIIDAPEKKKVPEDFTKKFGHDNISFDPKLDLKDPGLNGHANKEKNGLYPDPNSYLGTKGSEQKKSF